MAPCNCQRSGVSETWALRVPIAGQRCVVCEKRNHGTRKWRLTMTPEPIKFDNVIYLEGDASDYKPRPKTAAEKRKWLAMLKKHSPGDYAWYLEQQKLRKKHKDASA